MKISKDFFRYGAVGFISFLCGLFVYWFFSDFLGYAAVLVTLIFTPIRFVVRYFANKKWVFKNENTN